MSFCPECKYEYREGIVVCPDCNVQLVESLPEEEDTSPEIDNQQLVSVYETESQVEFNLVKNMLESSGVDVYEQPDMSYYGNFAQTVVDLQIFVLESDVERAKQIIEESRDPEMENIIDESES